MIIKDVGFSLRMGYKLMYKCPINYLQITIFIKTMLYL